MLLPNTKETDCNLVPAVLSGRRMNLLFFFFNTTLYLFIYLGLCLGLLCCVWAFSSCGEQGLLFVAVRGLLIVVASLTAEHGL